MINEVTSRALDCATADIVPMSEKRYDRFSFWVYNRYVRLWGARRAHAPGFFILVKKRFHEKIGRFDEAVVFCEDHEYAQRAAAAGQFGFLQSVKIPTSVRRFDKDGRFTIARKFLKAEWHLLTKGPIYDDRFHYRFGYARLDNFEPDHPRHAFTNDSTDQNVELSQRTGESPQE